MNSNTTIAANISALREQIPSHVKLIAVSKTVSVDQIKEAYDQGIRDFGENRVQEILSKHKQLPEDIYWHLIGHLQTNKVKSILPYVSMIHSVDSIKLLRVINNEAKKIDRTIPCLLQFHIAQEETKFGFSLDEVESFLTSDEISTFNNILICGVMGMASFTDDTNQVAKEFESLFKIFTHLKNRYFPNNEHFKDISMGMSSDFNIAISQGSSMVRIGSNVFGVRS